MREQPEQQAPPVQRLRIRYAKRGRLRFTSHRDFSRAFERAIFRARLPMAYSSGFNPHPRISYAGAAPTGSASEAEYLEIGLRELVDPEQILAELREALPDGLDVMEVVDAPASGPRSSLADLLTGSRWRIALPEADPATLAPAVAAYLGADELLVERMTKKGLRVFDCRSAVLSLAVVSQEGAELEMVLRHGTPAVRPDDVMTGLAQVSGTAFGRPLYTRLSQGPLDETTGAIGDPLAPPGA